MTERELLEKLAINNLCLIKSCSNSTFVKDFDNGVICLQHSKEITKGYGWFTGEFNFYNWIDNYDRR